MTSYWSKPWKKYCLVWTSCIRNKTRQIYSNNGATLNSQLACQRKDWKFFTFSRKCVRLLEATSETLNQSWIWNASSTSLLKSMPFSFSRTSSEILHKTLGSFNSRWVSVCNCCTNLRFKIHCAYWKSCSKHVHDLHWQIQTAGRSVKRDSKISTRFEKKTGLVLIVAYKIGRASCRERV